MILFELKYQEAMEKAIKNKVAKAVVPAIDVMFQALRSASYRVLIWSTFALFVFWLLFSAISHIYGLLFL